jgi:hypothetical protein
VRAVKSSAATPRFSGRLGFKMIFLLASALAWLLAVPVQQSPAPKGVVRPCADSWNDSGSNSKKNRTNKSKKDTHPEAGACVELAFSALEIQEYLQSHAREEQWKIAGDQITEDSWTFSLEMGKEDLLRDTTEDSKKKRVDWDAGTVRVHVNSVPLADGYTRTIVRASFRGYGRNEDQFAMKQEYWELESNNNFENSLVSALQTHFGAGSPEGTSRNADRARNSRPCNSNQDGCVPVFSK